MAATPLFQSLDNLKAKLRMSNLPSTGDVNTLLDQAVSDARLTFYRRLGTTKVAALVALPSSSTPTTEDQVLRSLAESTEVKSVRLELLCVIPYAWQDASGGINKQWNEEAPFRSMNEDDRAALKARLENQIEEAFQLLSDEEQVGAEQNMRVFDGSPDTAPPAPLDSARRLNTRNINTED